MMILSCYCYFIMCFLKIHLIFGTRWIVYVIMLGEKRMFMDKRIQYQLERLSYSKFRSRFHLKEKDILYIQQKGLDTIQRHAYDFINQRLAPAMIHNDGKQTPMRGHPVFIAQHATGTCCRGCLYKWHHIQPGVELSQVQKDYIVAVIMEWIKKEYGEE